MDKDKKMPRNPDIDDFKLDITDESFHNLPDADIQQTGTRTPISRQQMENGGTQSYLADVDRKKQRKEHKRRDKLKSIKNRRVFRLVWWAMVIMVALSFASYLITGSNDLFAVGRREGETKITVPKEVTSNQLTDILVEAGAVKAPEFFKIYCDLTTNMDFFTPGTFMIPTNMDYQEMISFLQAGSSRETVEITFREGLNVEEVAALLEENGVCAKADVLEAVASGNFDDYDMIERITNKADKYYQLEGYLFPDTYQFYMGEAPDSVLKKMLGNFQNRISKELLDEITNSGMSWDQVVILASIIQAEAANAEDMYRVSAVLNNRIEFGAEADIFTLGCDSTMYYPYHTKADAPEGYASRYDTYVVQGLPAGAINNPGLEAIKAAVRPDSDYSDSLYFCHSADGTAYYAATAAGHESNLVEAGLVN